MSIEGYSFSQGHNHHSESIFVNVIISHPTPADDELCPDLFSKVEQGPCLCLLLELIHQFGNDQAVSVQNNGSTLHWFRQQHLLGKLQVCGVYQPTWLLSL